MRGTTLAETMVALALLALTALFVMSLFPVLYEAQFQSRTRWWATTLATQYALKWRKATGPMSTTESIHGTKKGRTVVQSFRITSTTRDDGPRRRVVTVTARWHEKGRDCQVVQETVSVPGVDW